MRASGRRPRGDDNAVTRLTLRLWQTAEVHSTMAAAAADQPVFSATNLIILLVAAAIFYPLQKKVRDVVSRRRRERWAEQDRLAEMERDADMGQEQQDGPPPGHDPL
jgi:hypothetical protein